MKIKYPLSKGNFIEEDIDALRDWLKNYPQITKGPLTLEVERDWANFIGTSHSLFCNSGSSANLLAIDAYKNSVFCKNNKVVVPSVGWATTISPVIQLGFDPIMIGADSDTFGIDLDELEEVCKKETPGCVVFVQVLGVPHKKERLLELKQKYGFFLIEDACAALGAEYQDDTKIGQVGDISTFSTFWGHQLNSFEGGFVNTNSLDLHRILLMLRSHGWVKDLDLEYKQQLLKENNIELFHEPFSFFIPGYNLRATDLQAFIMRRQIAKAQKSFNQRNRNHLRYGEKLNKSITYQNWFRNKPVSISFGAIAKSKEQREVIVKALVKNGIETRLFSAGNLGKHPFWAKRYGEFNNKVSDMIHSRGFFLPNDAAYNENDIDFICDIVNFVS